MYIVYEYDTYWAEEQPPGTFGFWRIRLRSKSWFNGCDRFSRGLIKLFSFNERTSDEVLGVAIRIF